jgi:cytochrome c oxidase subunit II
MDISPGRSSMRMTRQMKHLRRALALFSPVVLAVSAGSSRVMAQSPRAWELGLQTPHSPVEASVHSLHALVTWLMTAIVVFVAALLGYVVYKFSAKRHPVASRTSHNTLLEVAWTVLPVLVLVVIAIPSFRLVYFEDRTRDADLTIKVTGHQWYWEYAYPDSNNIHFESYMLQPENLAPGQLRNLSVDNPLVVPAGKNIRILTTGADVIHSFFIPSLGVQRYAIPGRTIETWMKIDQPGDYYGECNQICGTNHSVMPISVHAVTDDEYKAWLEQAKTKFASDLPPPAPKTGQAFAAVTEQQR